MNYWFNSIVWCVYYIKCKPTYLTHSKNVVFPTCFTALVSASSGEHSSYYNQIMRRELLHSNVFRFKIVSAHILGVLWDFYLCYTCKNVIQCFLLCTGLLNNVEYVDKYNIQENIFLMMPTVWNMLEIRHF